VISTEHGFEIHRIVVAIDSSAHAASALEAAATLAAELHAELEGIFVEDINLARLAELPVGREIQFLTGQARDFTAAALEAQNKEQEFSARRAIAAAATRARITHVFRVARGQVDVEVISAAGNADLLILGMGGGSPGGRGRLGSTARAAAERAPHSVLISKPGMRSIGAPLVCYDGSDGAKRALEAAIRLSGVRENGITVLIVARDVDQAGVLRQEVDGRLEPLRMRPKFLHSAHPAPDQMCRFATESGADVLVISADSDLIGGAEKLKMLEQIACPVLLVR
jgi:nucleotide-binding universal stress UspA family protein